jgi:hypothetical protein
MQRDGLVPDRDLPFLAVHWTSTLGTLLSRFTPTPFLRFPKRPNVQMLTAQTLRVILQTSGHPPGTFAKMP